MVRRAKREPLSWSAMSKLRSIAFGCRLSAEVQEPWPHTDLGIVVTGWTWEYDGRYLNHLARRGLITLNYREASGMFLLLPSVVRGSRGRTLVRVSVTPEGWDELGFASLAAESRNMEALQRLGASTSGRMLTHDETLKILGLKCS